MLLEFSCPPCTRGHTGLLSVVSVSVNVLPKRALPLHSLRPPLPPTVIGSEPRASHMLSKCFVAEVCIPQLYNARWWPLGRNPLAYNFSRQCSFQLWRTLLLPELQKAALRGCNPLFLGAKEDGSSGCSSPGEENLVIS